MNLNIKDVSALLSLQEKEIRKLVKQHDIPSQSIGDDISFNKQQIIEWALMRNIPLNISESGKMSEYQVDTIGTILGEESFFYNCDFTSEGYIESMVSLLLPEETAKGEIIIQLLKNREALMSTSMGNGISLPHPRIPLMIGQKPIIRFFFTKNPLDLKAIDGKPVHTIILLISQTIKQHLSILTHLGYLLSQGIFRFTLEQRLPYEEILDIITHIERKRTL